MIDLTMFNLLFLAESGGFEPPEAFTSSLFESDTFNHSDNSPYKIYVNFAIDMLVFYIK